MMRVLVVEDDARVAQALEGVLRRRGHEVVRAASSTQALAAPAVDLVLLDLGLPDGDGVRVCRELRRRSDVAIIMVTARGDERDRVAGLRTGADDYHVKPFGLAELQARIDAVMRRASRGRRELTTIEIGPLHIDMRAHVVKVAGREIALTRKEYDLLIALARRPGELVTRDELLSEVWLTTWTGGQHTVEVHLGSLRAKLADPGLIQTVRNAGYRLRVDPAPSDASST